jgi:hypothetical protein
MFPFGHVGPSALGIHALTHPGRFVSQLLASAGSRDLHFTLNHCTLKKNLESKDIAMGKKWTAVQYDLTKILTPLAAHKRLDIPQGLKLELVIDLDDAAYTKLSKDPTWLQKMQTKANEKVQPTLEVVKKKVKDTDEKVNKIVIGASKLDPKTALIFQNDINTYINQQMTAAGKAMATEVDKFFEEYKKNDKALQTFRFKSGGKITLNAISIVASAAVAGATHAVLAPPAIVAIVRSAIVISQECTKLALNADKFAVIINGELKALMVIMEKGKAKAAKEVALSAISGVLGIETPSVTNLGSHIEVHKHDITKLAIESHKLSPKINEALDKQDKWQKKVEGQKDLPPAKVTKLKEKIKKAETALDALVKAVVKVNEAVERAEKRQEKYEKALADLKKGVPGWVAYVTPLVGLATDIGLSVAAGGAALDIALGVIETAEIDIASALMG